MPGERSYRVGRTPYFGAPTIVDGACAWCGARLVQWSWEPPRCLERCGYDVAVMHGPVEHSGFGPVTW